MNLPNKLTILRVIMVPIFMIVVLAPLPELLSGILGAVVFGLTALTDMLDGKIARKYNLITNFGKFMDPLADKFMVISALLAIMVAQPQIGNVLAWVTAIVVLRELAVTSVRLVAAGAEGVVIAASYLGKLKTCTQIACILVLLLEPVLFPETWVIFSQYRLLSYVTMGAMLVMTVWSGVDYFKAYAKFLDPTK